MGNNITGRFLNHPILSSRYFFPWPNTFDDPFIVQGQGFQLGCRYRRVSDRQPTIIFFHGNGECVADYIGDFEDLILESGANLLLAEYRGYGMSSGAPALADMLDDVTLLVQASGVPPEQIIFFGRSLGSLYAVHGAALYPNAAGLIIESGLADPLERILVRIEPRDVGATAIELQNEVHTLFNQHGKIKSFCGSTLILHTKQDDMVSVTHAEHLYDWAPLPKQLHIFERGDHNSIMAVNQQAYFAAIKTFLQSLTRRSQHGNDR